VATYATYVVVAGDTLSGIAGQFGTTYQVLQDLNHLPNPNLIYPGQQLSVPVAGEQNGNDPESNDILERVLQFGRAEIGKPYCGPMVNQPDSMRYGDPGWDCSSFSSGMYARATDGAVQLTAYTDAAYDQCVPVGNPQPGHLVFYRYDDGDPNTTSRYPHMGIWLNEQQTLDCRYPMGVGIHDHLNTPREVRAPSIVANSTNSTNGTIGGSASQTYTVVAGDNLSSIAARFGTTWQALAELNGIPNPDLIHPGQVLQVA
jgi:lysozyme